VQIHGLTLSTGFGVAWVGTGWFGEAGRVAPLVAAGSVGKYNTPGCPQPLRPSTKATPKLTLIPSRLSRLTKIWFFNNIHKL
jgi:hypothetical protein